METQQFAGGSLLFHILYEYAVSLRQITDLLKKVEVLDFTCFVGCCGFWLCQEPTEWQRYWEATKLEATGAARVGTASPGSCISTTYSGLVHPRRLVRGPTSEQKRDTIAISCNVLCISCKYFV